MEVLSSYSSTEEMSGKGVVTCSDAPFKSFMSSFTTLKVVVLVATSLDTLDLGAGKNRTNFLGKNCVVLQGKSLETLDLGAAKFRTSLLGRDCETFCLALRSCPVCSLLHSGRWRGCCS